MRKMLNIRPVFCSGEFLGELLSIIINPEGIIKLTNLPRGSGEVELMGLLPIFYVYDYIEQTEQWGKIREFGNGIFLKRKMQQGKSCFMLDQMLWDIKYNI